jgi:hypothetical protein
MDFAALKAKKPKSAYSTCRSTEALPMRHSVPCYSSFSMQRVLHSDEEHSIKQTKRNLQAVCPHLVVAVGLPT